MPVRVNTAPLIPIQPTNGPSHLSINLSINKLTIKRPFLSLSPSELALSLWLNILIARYDSYCRNGLLYTAWWWRSAKESSTNHANLFSHRPFHTIMMCVWRIIIIMMAKKFKQHPNSRCVCAASLTSLCSTWILCVFYVLLKLHFLRKFNEEKKRNRNFRALSAWHTHSPG